MKCNYFKDNVIKKATETHVNLQMLFNLYLCSTQNPFHYEHRPFYLPTKSLLNSGLHTTSDSMNENILSNDTVGKLTHGEHNNVAITSHVFS